MSKIIVFDGLNGSGKTTVIGELKTKLKNDTDYKISNYFLPGSGIPEIRNIFKDPNNQFDGLTYLLLTASDTNELINKVLIPAENNKKHIILLDRFVNSIFVYQHYRDKVDNNTINLVVNKLTSNIKIDHTFIFDITYDTSEKRRSQDILKDAYEKDFDKTFHILRYGYIEESRKPRHELVCAEKPLDDIVDFCYSRIKEII